MKIADTLVNRASGLPGIGVMFGYSGYGKTVAANYVRNATGAHLIEVKSYWSKKAFAESLLVALHDPNPKGTVTQMLDRAIRILGDDPKRPLLIDEADIAIDKGWIDDIRGLQEAAQVPMILVGEERLPRKIERSERTFDRVLHSAWYMALPCDEADARQLARLFCPDVELADDLILEIIKQTSGKARRIVTTCHSIREWARLHGAQSVDAKSYGGDFATGRVPTRHMVEGTRSSRARV
ncbi:MAG: ATP-binding protein [Pseudomonadota bacterium]